MISLNFDSIGKFFTSLGISLIIIGFIWFLGYLWVIDQQTDRYINTQLEIIKLRNNQNLERINIIDGILKEKADAIYRLESAAKYQSYFFNFLGGVSLLFGLWLWIRENNSKK